MQMNDLILKLYEFLTVIVPFIVAVAILNRRAKNRGIAFSKSHLMWVALFSIYVFAAFYVTGVSTLYDLTGYGMAIHSEQINFLPFSKDIDTLAYLQNVLLFMPLGFLIPLIWQHIRKLKYAVFFGSSFSLLIEISQLFNNRRTDIDDWMLNTVGALLGYAVFKAITRVAKWDAIQTCSCKYEPIIYIGAMFLGRFLLYNEFGLAKILYNL